MTHIPTVWLIHNDQPQLDLVENRFVSVGWPMMGDLSVIGDDQDAMKRAVEARIHGIKPGAVAGTAGMLRAFAFTMQVGDWVVYPHKPDGTVNIGRIAGGYTYDPARELHPHRRDVNWDVTDKSRSLLSQGARNEIGGALTIFRVRRHVEEVLALRNEDELRALQERRAVEAAPEDPAATDSAPDEVTPSADQIEQNTRDFVIDTLYRRLEGVEFEEFVAHVLEAMGYHTEVTRGSGDGGVDIIASHSALGLEPPIIKVQCKKVRDAIGGPVVQRLTGTLGPGGSELGLFVTLGAFSRDAEHIARNRHDLKLISGNDLVDLIFDHYGTFSAKYKALLPLRSVYVVEDRAV